jgi:hypothetical protein
MWALGGGREWGDAGQSNSVSIADAALAVRLVLWRNRDRQYALMTRCECRAHGILPRDRSRSLGPVATSPYHLLPGRSIGAACVPSYTGRSSPPVANSNGPLFNGQTIRIISAVGKPANSRFVTRSDRNRASRVVATLTGGDRRSIGRANRVAALAARDPVLLEMLFRTMLGEGPYGADPCVRLRCADAAEKATNGRPLLLRPFRTALFRAGGSSEAEVRWHVAQMLPRLNLTRHGRARVATVLRRYLDDDSRIVRACAVEGLAQLAHTGPELHAEVLRLIRSLSQTGSPAVRARARRMLTTLSKNC